MKQDAPLTIEPWSDAAAGQAGVKGFSHVHKFRWPAKWDVLTFPTSDDEAKQLVEDCRRNHDEMVCHLEDAVAERRIRQARNLQRLFLKSDTAKVAGVSYAEARRWRNLSPEARADRKLHGPPRRTALQIAQVAQGLDMWAYSGEPVFLKPQQKSNGEVRSTFAYGLQEYARQRIAVTAATPFLRLSPRQFQLNGGLNAVWEWLDQNLPNAVRVITTDIPACFCVLDRGHANDDGLLPSAVMRSVLFDPLASVKGESWKPVSGKNGPIYLKGVSSGYSLQESLNGPGSGQPRGVPPGAALSSLVAEARLRHILDAVEDVGEGVLAASLADNIIILVSDAELAAASKNALFNAVLAECGEDAAAMLRGRTETINPRKAEISFLKCRVTMEKGKMRRRMTPGKYEEFLCRLAVQSHFNPMSKERIKSKIDGWRAAHAYDPNAIHAAIEAFSDHGFGS